MHRHKNQTHIDKLGNAEKTAAFDISLSGETADDRTWSVYDGLRRGNNDPVDVEGKVGISFDVLTRVSPEGKVFGRELVLDGCGAIIVVGKERVVSNAGGGMFQATATGITPIGLVEVGRNDAFFSRTPDGFETRTTFTPESETPYMKTPDGEDIQLKSEE